MNKIILCTSFLVSVFTGSNLLAQGGGGVGTWPTDNLSILPSELMQVMNAPGSSFSPKGEAFVVYQDGFVYNVSNPDQTFSTVDQTFDFGNQSYLHLVNPANFNELAIQSSNPVDVLRLKEEKTLHVFVADDETIDLIHSESGQK